MASHLNKMVNWMETHPLAMITAFLGARDIVFGTMLALSDPYITNATVYQNLKTLGAIPEFGIAMAILGVVSIVGGVRDKARMTAWAMGATAYGWGFCMVGMMVAGQWSLSMLYLTAYVGLTAFVGYRWKWIRTTGIPSPVAGVIELEDTHGRQG
jgi:hypothetical protein